MDNDTTRLCPMCGKEFQITAKHPNVRFCSLQCYAKTRRSREIRNCLKCDAEFETTLANDKKFCTSSCANRYNQKPDPSKRETRKCKGCGCDFEAWVYRETVFCSHRCMSKYAARQPKKIGPVAPQSRGKNWSTQRKLALARDGYACQICGKKKSKVRTHDITVHHIVKYGDFQNDYITANQLSNLITLCRLCHEQVENYGLPCPKRMF